MSSNLHFENTLGEVEKRRQEKFPILNEILGVIFSLNMLWKKKSSFHALSDWYILERLCVSHYFFVWEMALES